MQLFEAIQKLIPGKKQNGESKGQTSPRSPKAPDQVPINKTDEAVEQFAQGLVSVKDIIAPSAIEVDFNHINIGGKFFRSYFTVDYPTAVTPNWLAPLINFEYLYTSPLSTILEIQQRYWID
jgi:hypothetical protein